MNPAYFGDSYDIVKRFFCGALRELGYTVYVDPMFTGDWSGSEKVFLDFIGAKCVEESTVRDSRAALFIDPDTGVSNKRSKQHVSIERLANELSKYSIVFAFDQSFTRNLSAGTQMRGKLAGLHDCGCFGFFYDSHARFVFAARSENLLRDIQQHLNQLGLPKIRFHPLMPTL